MCKTNPIPLAVTVYDRRTPRAKFCHYIHHNLDSVTLPFSPTADAGEPEIVEKINGKSKVIYYWAFGHLLGICLFNLDIFNWNVKMLRYQLERDLIMTAGFSSGRGCHPINSIQVQRQRRRRDCSERQRTESLQADQAGYHLTN